jgi:DNA-binding MarR family transcriptional regulator
VKKGGRVTPRQIEVATRLRIAFALVTRAQRQQVRGALTSVQLSALHKVDMHGPIRLGDLAGREQVASPTMTRVVASLECASLVTRTIDPSNARCSLVTITKAGREQLDTVRRDRTDYMSCRLSTLSLRHQRALGEALPALDALVEAVLPGDDVARREIERSRDARRPRRKHRT